MYISSHCSPLHFILSVLYIEFWYNYIWQANGPTWEVPLGRRDSLTANQTLANQNLPAPTFNLTQLKQAFENQNLNTTDLVALSGMKIFTFNKKNVHIVCLEAHSMYHEVVGLSNISLELLNM